MRFSTVPLPFVPPIHRRLVVPRAIGKIAIEKLFHRKLLCNWFYIRYNQRWKVIPPILLLFHSPPPSPAPFVPKRTCIIRAWAGTSAITIHPAAKSASVPNRRLSTSALFWNTLACLSHVPAVQRHYSSDESKSTQTGLPSGWTDDDWDDEACSKFSSALVLRRGHPGVTSSPLEDSPS